MNKKTIWVLVIIFALTVGAVTGIKMLIPDNTWICDNEEWVKRGNPQTPKPSYKCGVDIDKNNPVKEETDWDIIKAAIKNCEVKEIMQAHSLEVTATLKDGRELRAVEPKIDDIIDIALEAEEKCGKIIMATE